MNVDLSTKFFKLGVGIVENLCIFILMLSDNEISQGSLIRHCYMIRSKAL